MSGLVKRTHCCDPAVAMPADPHVHIAGSPVELHICIGDNKLARSRNACGTLSSLSLCQLCKKQVIF